MSQFSSIYEDIYCPIQKTISPNPSSAKQKNKLHSLISGIMPHQNYSKQKRIKVQPDSEKESLENLLKQKDELLQKYKQRITAAESNVRYLSEKGILYSKDLIRHLADKKSQQKIEHLSPQVLTIREREGRQSDIRIEEKTLEIQQLKRKIKTLQEQSRQQRQQIEMEKELRKEGEHIRQEQGLERLRYIQMLKQQRKQMEDQNCVLRDRLISVTKQQQQFERQISLKRISECQLKTKIARLSEELEEQKRQKMKIQEKQRQLEMTVMRESRIVADLRRNIAFLKQQKCIQQEQIKKMLTSLQQYQKQIQRLKQKAEIELPEKLKISFDQRAHFQKLAIEYYKQGVQYKNQSIETKTKINESIDNYFALQLCNFSQLGEGYYREEILQCINCAENSLINLVKVTAQEYR